MRQVGVGGGWAVVGVLVVLTLLRWTHLDVHSTVLIAASTGAPFVLWPTWAVALVGVGFRERWLALTSVGLIVVHLLVLAPLVAGGRGLTPAQRSASAVRI